MAIKMRKVKIFSEKKSSCWECPEDFAYAHGLCMLVCKFSMQIVLSGHAHNVFGLKVEASEDEIAQLDVSQDIWEWLEQTGRNEDRAELTARVAFQAVLEDMMICLEKAVECAGEGKMTLAFMLLRKPLEENLIILEEIARGKIAFADKFENARNLIEKAGYGGLSGHAKRIQDVLDIAGLQDVFDASYLAELRYDKNSRDTFYGVCNKAMHLFTSKQPIATEEMNINLIFSSEKELLTQAAYFYSRLPYLLIYIMEMLEHVVGSIVSTHAEYVNYQRRRVYSLFLLGRGCIDEHYDDGRIETLFIYASLWLEYDCKSKGSRSPKRDDLNRMALLGCYPDESDEEAQMRIDFFNNFKVSDS